MKKIYFSLLTCASLGFVSETYAAEPTQGPAAQGQAKSSVTFTTAQVGEIEKVVGDYLNKHPEIIMSSLQAGMEQQQKDAITKMEKAVVDNKDKIFNDPSSPVIGNPKGTQSLVVFMDPNCGFCKKFHVELVSLLTTNKNVKVILKDIPIMGDDSVLTIKALLASKNQGKYEQFQSAIYTSDKPLTKELLLKTAKSLGIDTIKLEADMQGKPIQTEIDQTLDLAKKIGINGTPTLIIGEKTVLPGFVTAEELNKKLQETTPPENKATGGKSS